MHRNTDVDNSVHSELQSMRNAKPVFGPFQEFYGEETTEVIQQLCRLRVQMVRSSLLSAFVKNCGV